MEKSRLKKNQKRNIAMQNLHCKYVREWKQNEGGVGGRQVGVRATTPGKERRDGKDGREGGRVVRANEPRSGSERGQQSGST